MPLVAAKYVLQYSAGIKQDKTDGGITQLNLSATQSFCCSKTLFYSNNTTAYMKLSDR